MWQEMSYFRVILDISHFKTWLNLFPDVRNLTDKKLRLYLEKLDEFFSIGMVFDITVLIRLQ